MGQDGSYKMCLLVRLYSPFPIYEYEYDLWFGRILISFPIIICVSILYMADTSLAERAKRWISTNYYIVIILIIVIVVVVYYYRDKIPFLRPTEKKDNRVNNLVKEINGA